MSSSYEVETVLSRRIALQDGAYERQYRTKWKNFSHSRNSWEPTDNFHGLKIIQEFESQRNKLIEKALLPRYCKLLNFLNFVTGNVILIVAPAPIG
jgi:Chromo (CHRromatin Organisation MOdifier) domain